MTTERFEEKGIVGKGIYSLGRNSCGSEPSRVEIEFLLLPDGQVVNGDKRRICDPCSEDRNLQSRIDLRGGGM